MSFPVAVIIDFGLNPATHQLPPVTIAFAMMAGMISSAAGLFFGKLERRPSF